MSFRIHFTAFVLPLFLFLACNDDNDVKWPTYEQGARLKRTLRSSSVQPDATLQILEDYTYDSQNRITRVSLPAYRDGTIAGELGYRIYTYNPEGQLVEIGHFYTDVNNPSRFSNEENHIYTYLENGMTEGERIEYTRFSEYSYSLLNTYDGNRLTGTSRYDNNGQLAGYTTFGYDDEGNLVLETHHGANGEIYNTTRHKFVRGLNTQTVIYIGTGSDKLREINRKYDANGNLIIVESKELSPLSSVAGFVLRHEYD